MHSFEWVDATSVRQAAGLLNESTDAEPVLAKAGGMDLLDLMKEGLLTPARLVNLQGIEELRGIERSADGGTHVGALTTLAQIAQHPQIQRSHPALAAAASHAATPQVRNAATLGGNLLQRPRCWYFRHRQLHDSPASVVNSVTGQHQYHAIFDNTATAMVHASTPATALIAYGASVHLTAANGASRAVLLQDFLLAPNSARVTDTAIARGEVLTHITLPAVSGRLRAAYHKQTERDSYDWPICDVAVVLEGTQAVESARIVLGWVAPTPRRAHESEQLLVGHRVDAHLAAKAAQLAVHGATPLARNHYKLAMLETVVRRTLLAAVTGEAPP